MTDRSDGWIGARQRDVKVVSVTLAAARRHHDEQAQGQGGGWGSHEKLRG
jgi:hypothetical protein